MAQHISQELNLQSFNQQLKTTPAVYAMLRLKVAGGCSSTRSYRANAKAWQQRCTHKDGSIFLFLMALAVQHACRQQVFLHIIKV
jgi:hypothetical protein